MKQCGHTDEKLLVKQRKEEAIRLQKEIEGIEATIIDQQRKVKRLRAQLNQVRSEYQTIERKAEAQAIELERWYVVNKGSDQTCFYPLKVHKDGKLGGLSIEIRKEFIVVRGPIKNLVTGELEDPFEAAVPVHKGPEELPLITLYKQRRYSPKSLIKDTKLKILVLHGDFSQIRDHALACPHRIQRYFEDNGTWYFDEETSQHLSHGH